MSKIRQRGMGTMYACSKCHTARQFGFGMPDDPKAKPPINCVKCGKVTPHEFTRVEPMVGLKAPYGETKWVFLSEVIDA